MYVAVGMGWGVEGISCPATGLGMSTKAQLDGSGVTGPVPLDEQLENNSAHKPGTKNREPRNLRKLKMETSSCGSYCIRKIRYIIPSRIHMLSVTPIYSGGNP
jgi:hypothetical protein